MPNVTTKNEFVELVIGFVNIDCSASTQFGYVSIFKSRTHGGPLIGRVYRASTVCNFDHFVDEQKNASSTSIQNEPRLTLTELGAFIEDREYTSEGHYQTLVILFFLPCFVWSFIFVRLSSVQVMLNMAIVSGHGESNIELSDNSGSINSISEAESENEMKHNRKETILSKYINPRIIRLWKLPVLHLLYVVVYILIQQVKDFDEGIIRDFISAFDTIHIDFGLHALLLASQEVIAWCLSVYSAVTQHKKGWDKQVRALIHTYQYSTRYLKILKGLNLTICVSLVLQAFHVLPREVGWIVLPLLAGAVVVCEGAMVIQGFSNHPFESSQACMIGGVSKGFSIMTRQITNYLAEQDVKGLSCFDRDPNCVPGMEYVGTLSDALVLARPDYVLEGLINGTVIQMAIIEQSCKSSPHFIRMSCVGNHQFLLVRHWLHKGKQNIALM